MQNARKQNSIRKEGYKCVAVVTGGCVWVRMGAHGCIGVGEHEKQTHKDTDTHGPNVYDFPATMSGKFPSRHVGKG